MGLGLAGDAFEDALGLAWGEVGAVEAQEYLAAEGGGAEVAISHADAGQRKGLGRAEHAASHGEAFARGEAHERGAVSGGDAW